MLLFTEKKPKQYCQYNYSFKGISKSIKDIAHSNKLLICRVALNFVSNSDVSRVVGSQITMFRVLRTASKQV